MEASNVLRRLSVSAATRAASASSARLRAFDRESDLPGKGLEQMLLFWQQQPAPLPRLYGQHAERAVAAP